MSHHWQQASPHAAYWVGDPSLLMRHWSGPDILADTLRQPIMLLHDPHDHTMAVATHGELHTSPVPNALPMVGMLPPIWPEWLGSRDFCALHKLRFAYMGGSMARGIASPELVIALAEIGALGMYGTAGLPLATVRSGLETLSHTLNPRGLSWGCNLIHSPNEPQLEADLVELYLEHDVRRVEASAYMQLTPAVVRYACSGVYQDADGQICRPNQLFAKVSREEVAKHFLSPAPERLLQELVDAGQLDTKQAELARHIPLAQQVIVEADSGGHTDNRPLTALFPAIARLRDTLQQQHGYPDAIFLGAAGGLGTPEALAAAYSLGADFVVLGSVHQAAVESGVSDDSRELLAKAGPADVAMTASADMFELGVQVQVLSRGTMMAVRGNHLYRLYRDYACIDDIPAAARERLEQQLFRQPIDSIWQQTQTYFQRQDPSQLAKASTDPKHRMALIFRWYLGQSSRWPLNGEADRRADYQLWCGPAMGAFNRWTAGSFLETPSARSVQQIALNLLEGAALFQRAQQLRSAGLSLSACASRYHPVPLSIAYTQGVHYG